MTQRLKSSVRPPVKSKAVLVKITVDDYAALFHKAQQLTGGNISEYVRQAAMRWQPKPDDVIDLPAPG